jgi:hypothetical protein
MRLIAHTKRYPMMEPRIHIGPRSLRVASKGSHVIPRPIRQSEINMMYSLLLARKHLTAQMAQRTGKNMNANRFHKERGTEGEGDDELIDSGFKLPIIFVVVNPLQTLKNRLLLR